MHTTNLSLPRAPFLLLLTHSRKRYPPHKFGNRSRHFPPTPNSLHRCGGNSAPRYPNGSRDSLMLTPKRITPGTWEYSALPVSRGTSTLLCPEAIPPLPTKLHTPAKTDPHLWGRGSGKEGLRGSPAPPYPEGKPGETEPVPSAGRRHRDPRGDPGPLLPPLGFCGIDRGMEKLRAGCVQPPPKTTDPAFCIIILIINTNVLFSEDGSALQLASKVPLSRRTGCP